MKYLLGAYLSFAGVLPVLAQTPATTVTDLPPAGLGSLHQSDVAILLRADNIQISVLPLDERVTRLLSPDTYKGLSGIRSAHQEELLEATPFGRDRVQVFLVTMYATRQRTQFDPERLTITSNNRYFRPLRIVPITPRWGEHQLDSRESSSALYLFDEGLDPLEPMIVEYGATVDLSWQQTLRRLETERALVEARARGTNHPR